MVSVVPKNILFSSVVSSSLSAGFSVKRNETASKIDVSGKFPFIFSQSPITSTYTVFTSSPTPFSALQMKFPDMLVFASIEISSTALETRSPEGSRHETFGYGFPNALHSIERFSTFKIVMFVGKSGKIFGGSKNVFSKKQL